MNDPTRLLEGELDEFEGSLLRSARNDQGSERARLRALAVFGALGVELAASTAAASAQGFAAAAATGVAAAPHATAVPALTLGAVAKWVGTGVVAGSVSVGAAVAVREYANSGAKPAAVTASESRETKRSVPAAVIRERAPIATADAPTRRLPARSREPSASAELRAPAAPAGALESSSAFPLDAPSSRLSEELAHLERVRRSLRSGDAVGALDELERYEARFPHGSLSNEATLLAVEARLRAGDTAGARAIAARVFAVDTTSPHAERLRALLSTKESP